jgi:hypothetical protein
MALNLCAPSDHNLLAQTILCLVVWNSFTFHLMMFEFDCIATYEVPHCFQNLWLESEIGRGG